MAFRKTVSIRWVRLVVLFLFYLVLYMAVSSGGASDDAGRWQIFWRIFARFNRGWGTSSGWAGLVLGVLIISGLWLWVESTISRDWKSPLRYAAILTLIGVCFGYRMSHLWNAIAGRPMNQLLDFPDGFFSGVGSTLFWGLAISLVRRRQ